MKNRSNQFQLPDGNVIVDRDATASNELFRSALKTREKLVYDWSQIEPSVEFSSQIQKGEERFELIFIHRFILVVVVRSYTNSSALIMATMEFDEVYEENRGVLVSNERFCVVFRRKTHLLESGTIENDVEFDRF